MNNSEEKVLNLIPSLSGILKPKKNLVPIYTRVAVEQVFQDPVKKTLIREIICGKLDHKTNVASLEDISGLRNAVMGPKRRWNQIEKPFNPPDVVPMDVDHSFDEKQQQQQPTAGRFCYEDDSSLQLSSSSNESSRQLAVRPTSQKAGINYLYIILAVICSICACHFYSNLNHSNTEINFNCELKVLGEKVYLQAEPVRAILNALTSINNWPHKVQIISLIGSNGVGKTFLASQLKNMFPYNTFEFYGGQLTNEIKINAMLSAVNGRKFVILVIDNLQAANLVDTINLIKAFELKNVRRLLVVPIFNYQYADGDLNYSINYGDVKLVSDGFANEFASSEVVVFEQFSQSDAANWLAIQMGPNRDEGRIDRVLRNHDVEFKGLKGLASKMQMEL